MELITLSPSPRDFTDCLLLVSPTLRMAFPNKRYQRDYLSLQQDFKHASCFTSELRKKVLKQIQTSRCNPLWPSTCIDLCPCLSVNPSLLAENLYADACIIRRTWHCPGSHSTWTKGKLQSLQSGDWWNEFGGSFHNTHYNCVVVWSPRVIRRLKCRGHTHMQTNLKQMYKAK